MKKLNVDNADGVVTKLQQVKVEVGGIVADDEIALCISEGEAHIETTHKSGILRFTKSQAKRFASQLLRMCRELKTADERGNINIRLTDKERFCLDAYIVNGNAYEAYLLSREAPIVTSSPESLAVMVSRWFSTKKVKEYIAMRNALADVSTKNINYTPIVGGTTTKTE